MSVKQNDIVTIKFTSGDEVVAKLVEIWDTRSYVVSKPHGVMMAQQGFGLVPWILTANPDDKIEIAQSAVVAITKTFDGVRKEYIKQTTGLIV